MDAFMALAVQEAIAGVKAGHGGPFGAVIVNDGRVIASDHNRVVFTNDPTAHAEVNVIRRASFLLGRFDLSDCMLYTTCEPCPMCFAAAEWARIPRVYFGATRHDAAKAGFDDAAMYDDVADPHSAKSLVLEALERDACLVAFAVWDNKEDRVPY